MNVRRHDPRVAALATVVRMLREENRNLPGSPKIEVTDYASIRRMGEDLSVAPGHMARQHQSYAYMLTAYMPKVRGEQDFPAAHYKAHNEAYSSSYPLLDEEDQAQLNAAYALLFG